MSTIIMSRCWPLRLPPVAKSVLISLADQANDHGVCWPSLATLCARVCCSERAVRNAIRWLEGSGLLTVEICAKKSNLYTLHPERFVPDVCVEDEPKQAPTPAPDAPRHHVPPGTTCRSPRHDVPPNRNRTVIEIPPIPPEGGNTPLTGDALVQTSGRKREARPLICLRTWLAQCEADGVKPIPAGDPIFAYCGKVGITDEMIVLHWGEFKRRYLDGGKRQADWRRKLRLSIEGNWYRLWYIGSDGASGLTTQGIQAKRAREGDQ